MNIFGNQTVIHSYCKGLRRKRYDAKAKVVLLLGNPCDQYTLAGGIALGCTSESASIFLYLSLIHIYLLIDRIAGILIRFAAGIVAEFVHGERQFILQTEQLEQGRAAFA